MGHHPSILLLAWLAGSAALMAPPAQAYQEIPITFEYPAFAGDFYVSGTVALPPGALREADNLAVYSSQPDKEVQSKIDITSRWPDGSVLKARVLFPANIQRQTAYQVRYGDEIRHRNSFAEAAVLPTVSFAVGGAAQIRENMDVSVGQINVRVDRSPQIYYYWHLIPIALIIIWAWFRARRARRVPAG